MYRSIKKIHNTPEPYRKRLAFTSAAVITVLIGVVWGIAMVQSFNGSQSDVDMVTNDLSLFTVVKDSFTNSINYALGKTSASATLSDNENILELELKKQPPQQKDKSVVHDKVPFLPEVTFEFLPNN